MIILPQTYQPQIATLCQYCGTDYSGDDCLQTADPATFVGQARKLLHTLDIWATLPPTLDYTHHMAQDFTSTAVSIIRSSQGVAEELERTFYVLCIKGIRNLATIRRKVVTFDPQKLMPLTIATSPEEKMLVMGVWVEMPRLLAQIADILALVGKAATMPRDTYQQSLSHWTPRFKQHIEAAIEAKGKQLEDFIAQAMATMGKLRQQMLIKHRDHASKMLASTAIGKLYLEKRQDSLEEFVTELRRLSIKGGKGMGGLTLAELVGYIVDYLWALRQLATITAPPTTIINNNIENNMINNYNCSIGKQIVNDGSGTMTVYADGENRQLSDNEQLLKTFFADDKFFEKTIAAAPTCTTADLVVTKIYRMLRFDAEMDEAILRSKPFLEALIGVLPDNPAFSVKNLQNAIQKKKI